LTSSTDGADAASHRRQSHGNTPTRGSVLAAGLLLGLTLAASIGLLVTQGWRVKLQAMPASGQILLPTREGLLLYSLADASQSPLLMLSPGQAVTAVAWSPDQTQIAYALFHRRADDSGNSQEIYLVRADGVGPRLLAERDQPGTVLETPVWSNDGREVYFAYSGSINNRPVRRLERVVVETGARSILEENGYAPAISPDGRSLLFVRDTPIGFGLARRIWAGLWMLPLDGGEPVPVLQPGRWPTIGVPRFSPDASRIAVSLPNARAAQVNDDGLLAWFRVPVAFAHHEQADIWTFNLQGNDGRRLTHLNADDPSQAWSPDGRYLAMWGGDGLYLVSATGEETRKLLSSGGYGPIDWRP
jgi:Tol biopolymer transport system component